MKIFALPMNPITAYSPLHIFIVAIIIIVSFLLALFLKNVLNISVLKVMGFSGILLAIIEIFKQFLLTYVHNGNYVWSGFPFQLCSTPMYLCFIYIFIKKLRQKIADFIMVYGLIGAIASFAVPYSTLTGYLFLTMQSFLWHGILMFLSLYLLLCRDKNKPSNYKSVAMIYIVLSAIAVLINIIFLNKSNGTINMFFLGPGFPNMFILDSIYNNTYWEIEALSMITASVFVGLLIYKIELIIKKYI